jgi:anti-sigma factor RsiW
MTHYDSEAISRYVDGEMEAAERDLLEGHFDECPACRRIRDEFLLLRDALGTYDGRPDRLAQRRALALILSGAAPVTGRRGVTMPTPVFASLVLALAAAVAAVAVLWAGNTPPGDAARAPVPAAPAAPDIDLSRYDGGRRLAIVVVKHAPEAGR